MRLPGFLPCLLFAPLLWTCAGPAPHFSEPDTVGSDVKVGGACSPSAPCADGYSCQSEVCVLSAHLPVSSSCNPPELSYGGLIGPESEPASCQRPVISPALPSGWVQSLGAHNVGEVVNFDVPPNTQSLTIISQALSALDSVSYSRTVPNSVAPSPLRGPAPGSPLYFDDLLPPPPDPPDAPLFYLPHGTSTGVMGLPNTSAMLDLSRANGLPAGQWQLTVNDYAQECLGISGCSGGSSSGSYDVQIVAKPGPARSNGTLDLAVYLVDTDGLNAASAVNDAHVRRMIHSLGLLYAQVGICLGKITFYELPAWAQQKYFGGVNGDPEPPCDELSQLFALSLPGNRLNLFLVPGLTSSALPAGQILLGMDGAIPGPSGYGGGVVSGAAVAIPDLNFGICQGDLDLQNCGADHVAFVTAHEAGHWLGLRHTTEAEGTLSDPLRQTGSCGCSSCAADPSRCLGQPGITDSNAHRMSGAECSLGTPSCSGGENLMFWLVHAQAQGLLTPEQGEVMRSNLAVQ